MYDLTTVEELLNAKEGEQIQFKEAKIGSIPMKLPGVAVLWPIVAEGNWCSAFPINVHEGS